MALGWAYGRIRSLRAVLSFGLLGCGGDIVAGGASDAGVGEDASMPVLSAETRAALVLLSPPTLPPPPPDVTNAYADNPAAARFGQRLFFDARFSGALMDGDNDGTVHALGLRGETGRVSCAGCHVPEDGFSDTRTLGGAISLGTGWGMRRTPSLLDVGQSPLLMWDGRHDTFYNQVFGPFESSFEMNSSRLFVAQQVFKNHRQEYEAIFGPLPPLGDSVRFPEITPEQTGCQHIDASRTPQRCDGSFHGMPGDGAEYDGLSAEDKDAVTRVIVNLGKAMGAYQRLLTCGQSRFDDFMHGDENALTASEVRGAALFVGKGHCADCHSGPYLADHKFHNVGLRAVTVSIVFSAVDDPGAVVGLADALKDPLNSKGHFSDGDDQRLPASVGPEYEGAFRTPMLRCVGSRPRFMHTGQLRSLEEVVTFFNRGGDSAGYPGQSELQPLNLTDEERADLAAFMRALEGPGPNSQLFAPNP